VADELNDEQHDPDTAMERFDALLGRIVKVSKDDLEKAERKAEEIVDEAIGPPPARGPALADDED
jgi:hypothetical protein